MKLTLLLLTTALLNVSAKSFSQSITFRGKNVPLEQVFKEIKRQTNYVVVCNADLLDGAKPVTIESKDEPLLEFLDDLFKSQPLEYSVTKTTIVVTEKVVPKKVPIAVEQPSAALTGLAGSTIGGRVTNSEGEPLVGASIVLKKKGKGTSTDAKGAFQLRDAEVGDEIIITYTGYTSQTIKIGSLKDLTIALKRSDSPLDEVQVVAYGTTTQRYTTANIATVSSKQIEMQPVTNPLLALQGQVPGLVVQQQSGYANAGIAVDIRGQASLNEGSAPLYVVDGVPYFGQLLPNYVDNFQGYSGSGSNQFEQQQGNTLSFINPADIESISILKDADATSIYGSRAAGGAILITTKKGKGGPTRVSASISQGWQKTSGFNKLMNSSQYLEMRHEAMMNSGVTPGPSDYDLNGSWDTTRSTNWEKVLLGGTGHWQDDNLNISGGNSTTQFYMSGTYHKETPSFINPTNVSDQKMSGYMSINSVSPNGRFSAHASVAYQFDNNQLPGADLTSTAISLPPVAPALYNTDGSLNWQMVNGAETWTNPLSAVIYQVTSLKTNNLISNARLGYKILPGLEVAMDAGYTYMVQGQYRSTSVEAFAPSIRQYVQARSYFANGYQTGWNLEPQLNYHRDGKKGHFDFLAGTTFTQSIASNQNITATGFISDVLMQDPSAAANVQYGQTVYDLYRYNALFSRASYRWDDKYILSLSARHDGSSRFGPENKFHTFGSVAASWIFSNERFLKASKILSFGKLTGSYGTVGNEQIGDYQYLSTYGASVIGTTGLTGLTPTGLSNPFLQWEVQHKLESRIDLGFVHDRILFSINYYRDRSSNQLMGYTLPGFTGFGGYTTNFPAIIQNSGTEIALQTANIKTHDFSWSTKFNLTFRSNKLVAFPDLAQSSYYTRLVVGKAFLGFRSSVYAGVNPQDGLPQFVSASGKKIYYTDLQNPKDFTDFINTQPTYFGGISNTFKYKGFELDFLVQFSNARIQNLNNLLFNYPGQGLINQPTVVLNRWRKPGDNAEFEAFETLPTDPQLSAFYRVVQSDFTYSKEYYVRLKNVSLQWQVPQPVINRLGVRETFIFCRAENLLTITNYTGSDPETGAFALPAMKVIEAGIKATF